MGQRHFQLDRIFKSCFVKLSSAGPIGSGYLGAWGSDPGQGNLVAFLVLYMPGAWHFYRRCTIARIEY